MEQGLVPEESDFYGGDTPEAAFEGDKDRDVQKTVDALRGLCRATADHLAGIMLSLKAFTMSREEIPRGNVYGEI